MSALIGKQLDHYRIDALLGQGGMGIVYRAWDGRLSRFVALKLMHPHLTRKPLFQARFKQEAQTVAPLSHPGIVRVYAYDQFEQHVFLVMELVEGQTLSAELRRLRESGQRSNLYQALLIGAQVAEALNYAHEQGVLHRDIKPGNIMLKPLAEPEKPGDPPFRAVVTDFGLASLLASGTAPGKMIGTLAYLSPEQCQEQELDGRADLYALGIILHEMTTGQLPFEISSATTAYHKHVQEIPADPREFNPDLPAAVSALILKSLAKKPADRFANGAAMAQALREAAALLTDEISTQPPQARLPLAVAPPAGTAAAEKLEDTRSQTRFTAPPPLTEMIADVSPADEATLTIIRAEKVERVLPLTANQYAIGRRSQNDIVLDDPRVSGAHLQITRTTSGWQVIDLGSKNSTRLHGRALPPHQPQEWRPDQTLQVGPYSLRWKNGGEADQAAVVATPHTPALHSAEQAAALHLIAAPTRLRVKPGERTEGQLSLTNMGTESDHFLIRQDGLPHDWVTIPQDIVQIQPGAGTTLPLTIHPPASSSALAGEYRFQIIVTPATNNADGVAVEMICTVAPFHRLQLQFHPQHLRNRGNIDVELTNAGNEPVQGRVFGRDPANAVQFDRRHPPRLIAPGDSVTLPLQVAPRRRPLLGRPMQHLFTITAEGTAAAGDDSPVPTEAEQGRLEVTPVFPSWLLPLLLLLVLFSVLGVFINNRVTENNAEATAIAQTATATTVFAVAAQTMIAVRQEQTAIAVGATATRTTMAATETAVAVIAVTTTAEADDDLDGIANYLELQNGLDKNNADTDGDGLVDGEEYYQLGTDPTSVDSDGDGLSDYTELFVTFTVPTNPDTDGDGEPDGADSDPLALPTATPTSTPLPTATATTAPPPTATGTPLPVVLEFSLAVPESGTIRYNQLSTYSLRTSSAANAPVISVGDEIFGGAKHTTRGFLTFSLQSLPAVDDILSAQLNLPQGQIVGDPFADLGDLIIETIEVAPGATTAEWYNASGIVILDDYLLVESSIDLTNVVRGLLASDQERLRLRFRFSLENSDTDSEADQFILPAGSNPTLTIRYYP
jgi:serine/threonine protein kinase